MAKVLIGNFKGPKGDKGDKGDTGPQGTQGLQGPEGSFNADAPVEFTEAAQDADIASGDTVKILFGKILKRFHVINNNVSGVIGKVYPVGSIYMSVKNTNPGTLFGGTWTAWGTGRMPIGIDTNDSKFNTVEKTGGESAHTLSTAEMPSHSHTFTGSAVTSGAQSTNHTHSFSGTTGGGGSHSHDIEVDYDTAQGGYGYSVHNGTTGGEKTLQALHAVGDHSHSYSGTTAAQSASHTHSVTAKGSISSTGSGGAHNNLPPYITCYMWKRTA